jgi:hypothetical protein
MAQFPDDTTALTRRQLIGTAAAAGASALASGAAAADLPARSKFVVRNAHVLTMDVGLALDSNEVVAQAVEPLAGLKQRAN